jgi:hypothetical protein
MPLSMSQVSVPHLVRMLENLTVILEKGEAFAEAKKIDPSVLLGARLAPDMFPLSRQVQIATDGAKGLVARLAGVEVPSYPDTETTFAELKARIARTIAFIQTVPAASIDGSEDKTITLKLRQEVSFPGRFYLLDFVIPNLHFHVTTAYLILRHNGVELGKIDYLGPLPG